MRLEMPDRWTDITDNPVTMTGSTTMLRPAVSQAYLAFYNSISTLPGYSATAADGGAKAGNEFQGAKCLYLIVTMGLEESDVMENFNASEYKDYDNTGCKVFVDAWGKPIRFLRWAPGFMVNPRHWRLPSHSALFRGCKPVGTATRPIRRASTAVRRRCPPAPTRPRSTSLPPR